MLRSRLYRRMFLRVIPHFFSIFYALSDENGPETARTLKSTKTIIFREISSEFCKIFRKTRGNLFFPDFFLKFCRFMRSSKPWDTEKHDFPEKNCEKREKMRRFFDKNARVVTLLRGACLKEKDLGSASGLRCIPDAGTPPRCCRRRPESAPAVRPALGVVL